MVVIEPNRHRLDIDIQISNQKKDIPIIVQNDSIIFDLGIYIKGEEYSLLDVDEITLAHTRPDGIVIVQEGTTNGHVATFEFGSTEVEVVGIVRAHAQFYKTTVEEGEEIKRVSTLGFTYRVEKDPTGDEFIPSEREQTLIERVLEEGPLIIDRAEEAAEYAEEQAKRAEAATDVIEEFADEVEYILGEIVAPNRETTVLTAGIHILRGDEVDPEDIDQHAPASIEIQGKTLVNLLGRDGKFDDIDRWIQMGADIGLAQDPVLYGENSFYVRGTSETVTGIDLITVQQSKLYIALYEHFPERLDGTTYQVTLRDYGNNDNFEPFPMRNTELNQWNKEYIKFNTNTRPTDGIRFCFGSYSGANANFDSYFDGLRIYEVTQQEYDNIGTIWDDDEVAARFPYVDDLQHITNPYVRAESENLLVGNDFEALDAANLIYHGPYHVEMNYSEPINGTFANGTKVIPNTDYLFNVDITFHVGTSFTMYIVGNNTGDTQITPNPGVPFLWNSTIDTEMNMRFVRGTNIAHIEVKNWMLSVGEEQKSFTPRNPSYLLTDVSLGEIDSKKDVLYQDGGTWTVYEQIKKDNILDGSRDWDLRDYGNPQPDGYHVFRTPNFAGSIGTPGTDNNTFRTISPQGEYYPNGYSYSGPRYSQINSNGSTYINVPAGSSGSGFDSGISFIAPEQIKSFTNGWRYRYNQTWLSVTGNGQEATDEEALTTKPTDYVDWKISYITDNPIPIDVNHLVEGSIQVVGETQIEIGAGGIRRELSNPVNTGTQSRINNLASPDSYLNYRADELFNIYKNSTIDNDWTITTDEFSYGRQRAAISNEIFDPEPDYYTYYTILDKHEFTANPTHVSFVYAKNLRAAVEDLSTEVNNNTKNIAFNRIAIDDLKDQLNYLIDPFSIAKEFDFNTTGSSYPMGDSTIYIDHLVGYLSAGPVIIKTTKISEKVVYQSIIHIGTANITNRTWNGNNWLLSSK